MLDDGACLWRRVREHRLPSTSAPTFAARAGPAVYRVFTEGYSGSTCANEPSKSPTSEPREQLRLLGSEFFVREDSRVAKGRELSKLLRDLS